MAFIKTPYPLGCRGLQKLYDNLFVYPFKNSSEFVILLILKVKDNERENDLSGEDEPFLIIHVFNNRTSKRTISNVITNIRGQKRQDINSLNAKIFMFGHNGCFFNHFSSIKDAGNIKCRRRSLFSNSPEGALDLKRMQQLNAFLTTLSLGSENSMAWGGEGVPPGLLLAVLGWSGRAPTATIEAFDPAGDTWRYLPQEDFVYRAYGGLVLCGRELFLVGGFDGRRCRRSALRFDGRRWRRAASMREARCYVSAVALCGRVCALGGCDGRRRFSSCERLGERWEPFADMRRVRSDASATVHQGRIFVSGGFDGEEVLSCAEVYDARTDQWSLVAHPMASPRSGHALVSFQGVLWAIGGFDGNKRLKKVEALVGERWVPRPSLRHPRSNFGAAALHEHLYVIGGYNGARTSAEVERLEEGGRVWRRARPLNKHRSAHGACVLQHAQDGCRDTEPPAVHAVRVASP